MANKYPNSGALFINEKRHNDRAPTMTGYVEIDAAMLDLLRSHMKNGSVRVRIAGWRKISGAGKEFLSINVSGVEEYREGRQGYVVRPGQPSEPPAQPTRARKATAGDDEIPF